jgi:hypothetical protein
MPVLSGVSHTKPPKLWSQREIPPVPPLDVVTEDTAVAPPLADVPDDDDAAAAVLLNVAEDWRAPFEDVIVEDTAAVPLNVTEESWRAPFNVEDGVPLDVLANDAESIETPLALDEVDPVLDAVVDTLTVPLNPLPALALDAGDDLAAALEPRPRFRRRATGGWLKISRSSELSDEEESG